jgi:hypothetical protein
MPRQRFLNSRRNYYTKNLLDSTVVKCYESTWLMGKGQSSTWVSSQPPPPTITKSCPNHSWSTLELVKALMQFLPFQGNCFTMCTSAMHTTPTKQHTIFTKSCVVCCYMLCITYYCLCVCVCVCIYIYVCIVRCMLKGSISDTMFAMTILFLVLVVYL